MARKTWQAGILVLFIVLALAGCSSSDDNNNNNAPALGTVYGTSGAAVSMDGAWSRGCIVNTSDSIIEKQAFTLNGGALTVSDSTWLDLTNITCAGTSDFGWVFSGTAAVGGTVTITGWVDSNGASTAPTGLEAVTTANGMTLTGTSATMTANTQAGADALNLGAQCGFTDWAVGVAKDVLTCLLQGGTNPWKESWVVDDSTSTTQLSLYEGTDTSVVDASGYPTTIENFDPLLK